MRLKNITFVLLSLIILSAPANAQDNFKKVAQSGMQYLKIGAGAQMVGRGEAGISFVKGAGSMFWNPAGLSYTEGTELLFSHNAWIAGISQQVFAGAHTLNNVGTFGVSLIWMNYGDLKKTSVATSAAASREGYIDEGTFSPVDLAVGLSYSKMISEQFSFGGQVKLLYEDYGSNTIINSAGLPENVNNTISTVSFDLGTVYYPGYKSLAFAMAIQNFSPDIKYQQEAFGPPLTFKLGLSMNMLDLFQANSNSSFLVAVDAIHPRDYTERINIGLEYDYLGIVQFRGGYRSNYDIGNYTAGLGVKYALTGGMQFNLDLSYMLVESGRFTNPLQLSAGIKF